MWQRRPPEGLQFFVENSQPGDDSYVVSSGGQSEWSLLESWDYVTDMHCSRVEHVISNLLLTIRDPFCRYGDYLNIYSANWRFVVVHHHYAEISFGSRFSQEPYIPGTSSHLSHRCIELALVLLKNTIKVILLCFQQASKPIVFLFFLL